MVVIDEMIAAGLGHSVQLVVRQLLSKVFA